MKKRTISGEMIVVVAVMGLGVLAMSVLQPVLPLYLTSIGVPPEVLGIMFSVAMVGMVLGESSWGWVADRIGLRLPLLMGTAVSALLVLCFALTTSVPAIFLIFFVWGTLRSALFGPGRGYIGTAAPALRKATFMAIIAVMLSASRSLGALPSGFIADTWGYNTVFFASCGIGLAGGCLVLLGLRRRRAAAAQPPASPPSSAGTLPSRIAASVFRPLASQCLVAMLQFLGLGVFMTFLPLLATQVVGVSATEVGVLFTISGIVAVVLGIPMGIAADRVGKKTFMVLGLVVSAAAMAGAAFADDFPWLVGFVILHSWGMAMFSPAALGMLSDSIAPQRQSTVMGVYGGVCENTGVIAGSALGGLIWSAWGPEATFLTGTVSGCLGAVVCIALVKARALRNPGDGAPDDGCC